MTLLEAITLGVIQGLTEFLPVSSTAHLRVIPPLLGWEDPGAAYSAVIQCGTLLAVVAAMWRDVVALSRGFVAGIVAGRPWQSVESRVALLIILGTLPIVVAGFALRDVVKGDARRMEVVIGALVAATLLMAAAEWVAARRSARGAAPRDGLEAIGLGDGLRMGFAQVLALVPGTSRSGVTIASGMLGGLDRSTAARFSFLLSLPAVAAAGLLEAWEERAGILGSTDGIVAALAGTAAAAVVGYAAIRWLLSMLGSRTLWPFIVYRLALAGLLAWALATGRVPSLG